MISYPVLRPQLRGIDDGFLRMSREEALARTRSVDTDVRVLASEGKLTVVDPKDSMRLWM